MDAPYTEASFSSKASEPCTSPLILRHQDEELISPRVMYTPEVWDELWFIVKTCPKEVGWLGLVDKVGASNDYLVTEIFVPKQLVTGSETEISDAAGGGYGELIMQLLDENKDTGKLLYWGHSHVDMGVSPSGQDENQVEEYLLNNIPFFIRGIYNKKGAARVDVYDCAAGLVHQWVDNHVQTPGLSAERMIALSDVIKTNVKERKPVTYRRNPWPPQGKGLHVVNGRRPVMDDWDDDDDDRFAINKAMPVIEDDSFDDDDYIEAAVALGKQVSDVTDNDVVQYWNMMLDKSTRS